MNNKTLAVAITELKEQIVNAINVSNIPIYLVKYALKDIYDEVIQIANTQVENEINQYKASQTQTAEENQPAEEEDIEEVETEIEED